jgi:hypothetical protein
LPSRIFGGISTDFGERFGERFGIGQIKGQRSKTHAHDMAMGVEETRDQCPALAIKLKVDVARTLVTPSQQLLDLAIVIDNHRGKADYLAVAIQRHAVDILDKAVGKRTARGQ